VLDPIAHSLERYMDLLAVRQRLVASNIANADTPGYKTQDIDFTAELRAAMNASADVAAAPTVQEVAGLRVKNDGNSVSLDREARLLAENTLRFQIASQLMRDELRTMRMAIQEGREG
jgi:flagellar basal-body rod protein FlgB